MGLGPTEKYHKQLHPLFEKGSLTCLDSEIIRSRASNLGPLVLNIEPTNMCNLNCSYCPSSKMRAKLGTHYLPINLIEEKLAINSDITARLMWINFHKDGEPLMHPELEKIINISHYVFPNAFTHLNTNGLMLTPSIGKSLLSSRIDDITVSIDAAWEETYNKQKGLDPRHKLFMALKHNVKEFFDERNRRAWQKIIDGNPTYDTRIRVKMIEFADTEPGEIEDFEAEWLLHADEIQITGAHDWGGGVDVDITDQTKPERHACPLLWYALAINSDQTVSICNVDWDRSGQIGSLERNTLQEIWQGPRLAEIRRLHLYKYWNSPRLPAVCKNCVVWAGCKNMDEILSKRFSML